MSTFFLANKIEHYFLLNNIEASFNDDVMTGHKLDEPEKILKWNVDKLGLQPTYEQIDAASAIYAAQLEAKRVAEETAANSAKQKAFAKLAALGLTTEELKILIG